MNLAQRVIAADLVVQGYKMSREEKIKLYRSNIIKLNSEFSRYHNEYGHKTSFWANKIILLQIEEKEEKRIIDGVLKLCRTGK